MHVPTALPICNHTSHTCASRCSSELHIPRICFPVDRAPSAWLRVDVRRCVFRRAPPRTAGNISHPEPCTAVHRHSPPRTIPPPHTTAQRVIDARIVELFFDWPVWTKVLGAPDRPRFPYMNPRMGLGTRPGLRLESCRNRSTHWTDLQRETVPE